VFARANHVADGKDNLVTEQPASDSPQTGTDRRSAGLDDSPLLAFERQFNAISAELPVIESSGRRGRSHAQSPND
jgi:hypothetical protein